jgi:hypothetical protein
MTQAPPEDDLAAEFRQLGHNLKEALKTAWESEESQKLQRELKAGLAGLEAGLKEAAQDFSAGEAGQRLKSEAGEFTERVRSGEVGARVRADLLAALRTVNQELQKVSRPRPAGGESGAPSEPEA